MTTARLPASPTMIALSRMGRRPNRVAVVGAVSSSALLCLLSFAAVVAVVAAVDVYLPSVVVDGVDTGAINDASSGAAAALTAAARGGGNGGRRRQTKLSGKDRLRRQVRLLRPEGGDGSSSSRGSSSSSSSSSRTNGRSDRFPAGSSEAWYLQKVLAELKDEGADGDSDGADGEEDAEDEHGRGLAPTEADRKFHDGDEEGEEGSGTGATPAIVAGERSDPNEFPFFVLAEGFECGGTLVARDVVMTAAHCQGLWDGRVLVGAYRRGSDAEGGARWRDVTSAMQVHPEHVPAPVRRNDVMLFRIAPAPDSLAPVGLNGDPSNPEAGANMTTAGFGLYRNDAATPRQPRYLQKATVQSLPNDVCNTLWKFSDSRTAYDPSVMTCTMGITTDGSAKGPCNGDSGGPLLDSNGKQVGVVSWGASVPDCSKPVVPAVYTRVSGVLDWIHETMCKLTADPEGLPFGCPDFVCPPDTTVFGLSGLKVPSASGRTRSLNGFAPVSITQTPAAGTPLEYGQDTLINVTATDSAGGSVSCRWKVTVPETNAIGAVAVRIEKGGSRSRTALFPDSKAPGVAYAFEGWVFEGSLEGTPEGVVRARLRSGQERTTPHITLNGAAQDAVLVLKKPIPVTYRSNLRVLVTAKDVPRTTVVIFILTGQQGHS